MKRTWCARLLDVLFPPKCPFCGRVLDEPGVCPKCEKTLPWIGEHLCERKVGQSVCAAPLWYEGAVRQALLHLKFHYAPGGAEPLGQLVARCAAEHFSGGFDVVTWVPVSRKRLRRRGYDQARLLAESACRCWDTKPVALLEKKEDNPAQSTLTEAAARRAMCWGSTGRCLRPRTAHIAHRRYLHHRRYPERMRPGTVRRRGRRGGLRGGGPQP